MSGLHSSTLAFRPRTMRFSPPRPSRDVWVWDLARAPVQLTLTPFAEWLPLWMPDGDRLIYGSWRGGNGVSNLYIQAADGTGQAERLSDSRYMHLPSAITADGSAVLFTVFGPAHGPDIHLVRLPRGGAPGLPKEEVVLDTPRSERGVSEGSCRARPPIGP